MDTKILEEPINLRVEEMQITGSPDDLLYIAIDGEQLPSNEYNVSTWQGNKVGIINGHRISLSAKEGSKLYSLSNEVHDVEIVYESNTLRKKLYVQDNLNNHYVAKAEYYDGYRDGDHYYELVKREHDNKWVLNYNTGQGNVLKKNQYGYFFVNTKGEYDPTYNGIATGGPLGKQAYAITNGKIDYSKTGLVKDPNSGYWYYVEKGGLNKDYQGLAKNQYGWFYVSNGELDKTYTGLAKNQYGWFYVKNGVLDRTYTGLAKNQYGWFYVNKGVLDKTYTGLAKNQYGWFFVRKGVLDRTFTGVAQNQYGKFYVKNGVLDKTFTGTAKGIDGKTYKVTKGVAK